MDKSGQIRFEVVGSHELAEKLTRLERESSGQLSILSSSQDKDPARLGLDLSQVYHIIIAVGEAFAFGHLSLELWKHLSSANDPEIIIETPKRMIRIKKSQNPSSDEIATTIKNLIDTDLK
jgi:hypothetical protein